MKRWSNSTYYLLGNHLALSDETRRLKLMKCIYCLEDKPRDAFTKAEHVIPQAFGSFKNNLTLNQSGNQTVCDVCNKYPRSDQVMAALKHIPDDKRYNQNLRHCVKHLMIKYSMVGQP